MKEETGQGKQEVATTNNGTEQKSRDSVSEEPGTFPGFEFLKELPPESRKVAEIAMSMHRFGPEPDPLIDKLTEGHIDKILDISKREDEHSYEDTRQSRKFTLVYVIIFIALFVFLTVFLVGADKDLYKEAIKLFAVFLGGFGGGFGLKSYMDRDK